MSQSPLRRSGQALLLLLMMMAVIVTITGSAAYRATTQTKAVKESEESKKAYQGAVGYLEQAIQNVTITPLAGLNRGVAPVRSVAENASGAAMTTKIARDGAYTLYLRNYNVDTNTFTAPAAGSPALSAMYYVVDADECPVFELTFVHLSGATNTVTRRVTTQMAGAGAPCSGYKFTVGPGGTPTTYTPTSEARTIDAIDFNRKITITSIPPNTNLIIIRPYFTNATIGFTATPVAQGRRIYSTARTAEGAQKTVSVYLPLPQIPAEFFVTSF